jgi:serine/threonine kinase 38
MKTKPLKSQPSLESINPETKTKVEIAKKYIEQKYQKNFEEERKRKQFYDEIITRMQHMNLSDNEREIITRELIQNEGKYLRERRKKETIADYETLAIIGRGAFGEVRLCRHKASKTLVAVKRMSKHDMNKKNQLNHIRAERDILASSDGKWIVELKSSFTDEHYLYLVMEFLPGGDLMNLLMEKDVFTEEQAKFYMAEMVLAVESVHKLNYIHRDLKPDNVLIDSDGHIKLTDFGLCKLYDQNPFNFTDLGSEIRKNMAANEESTQSNQPKKQSKVG